jgi:hypothetical protein
MDKIYILKTFAAILLILKMVVRVSCFYQSFTCFILSFIRFKLNVLKKPTVLWGGSFDKSDGLCSYYIISNIRCISARKNFIKHFLFLFIYLFILFVYKKLDYIFPIQVECYLIVLV